MEAGGGGQAAAGWESGLVSCLEGKGPAEGSGGRSSRQAHPSLSPSLSSLLETRGNREPRVGRAGRVPELEEVALGAAPLTDSPLCPTPWARSALKSSAPWPFFLTFSNSAGIPLGELQRATNPRAVRSLQEAPLPALFQLCLPLTALSAHRFSVRQAGRVGGGWGGARVGMKGPFSSTAGRAAATKASLDTVCPEPSGQLASPPGIPLLLTSLSLPVGTAVARTVCHRSQRGLTGVQRDGAASALPLHELANLFPDQGAVGGGTVGPLWRAQPGKGRWGARRCRTECTSWRT